MAEFRVWVSLYGETRWVVLEAADEESARKLARQKYGKRLQSVRPIVKAKERQA